MVEDNVVCRRRAKVNLVDVMEKVVRNISYQKLPERSPKRTKILLTRAHIYHLKKQMQ